MKRKLFLIVAIISITQGIWSQERIVKIYGSEKSNSDLMLYPDSSYCVIYIEELAEDIFNVDTLTAGKWIVESDTLYLHDSLKNKVSTTKEVYRLLMLNENELINHTLAYYPVNESLKIVGLWDIENRWRFSGHLNSGKMTGVKIDLKENVVYKLEAGEIKEVHKIE